MHELLIRTLYAVFLLIIYIIGEMLTKHYGLDIELKYILPLMSVVFLEYWIRVFSHLFFKIKLRHKSVNKSCLRLDLRFCYLGTKRMRFNIESIKNIKGIDPILILDNPDNKQVKYHVPEKFIMDLGADRSVFEFTILCNFLRAPKYLFKVFRYKIFIYIPVVKFEFGNHKKSKIYLLIRFEKEVDK